MKFVILCALVTQAFALNIPQSPHVGVPEEKVPQLGVQAVGIPQVGDVPHVVKPTKLPSPQVQQLAEQHINHILQHVPQVQAHIKQEQNNAMPTVPTHQQKQLPAHIKQQINQHIDHIIKHVKVHRVPQTVLAEHLAKEQQKKQQVQQKDAPAQQQSALGADKLHQISQHAMQHIPQVINHLNEKVAPGSQVPGHLHITIGHGKDPQQVSELTNKLHQISQQAQQHIPQVINQVLQKKAQQQDKVSEKVAPAVVASDVPAKVQAVVQQVHQHVPQILEHHKSRAARAVVIPEQVLQISQQAQQHIPQVINQAQQQKGKKEEKVSEKVAAAVVPPKVQAVVQQVHQHVPQIIANQKTRV